MGSNRSPEVIVVDTQTDPDIQAEAQKEPALLPARKQHSRRQRILLPGTFSPAWLPHPWSSPLMSYIAAVFLPLVSALLSWLIALFVPEFGLRGIFLLVSALVVAYLWGTGPGLLATLLQALLSNVVRSFPTIAWTYTSQTIPQLVASLVIGAILCLLISRLVYALYEAQYARQQVEQVAKQLEQEKIQAAKHANELEATIAAIADEIYVYNIDGNVRRSNRTAREFNPYLLQEEYMERPFPERFASFLIRDETGQLLSVEQIPATRVLRGETLTGDNTVDILLRGVDGGDRFFNVSGAPIRDETGKVQGAVVAMRDMSGRKQLERESAIRARELSTLLETVPDAISVFDLEGRIIQRNESARQLLSLYATSINEPLPLRYNQIQPRNPDGTLISQQDSAVARILRGETLTGSSSMDMIVRTFTGEDLWLNIAGAPLYDDKGQLTGGVAITRDLTAQRQAERRASETLQAFLKFSEELVQAGLSPQLEEDAEANKSIGVDPVAQRLATLMKQILGYRQVDLTIFKAGSHETTKGYPHEADQTGHISNSDILASDLFKDTALEAQLLTGDAIALDLSKPPFSQISADYKSHSLLLVPMMLDGQPIGIVTFSATEHSYEYTEEEIGLARALTELTALTLERQRLFQEHTRDQALVLALSETNRLMDEFIGIAGHELRTPLTAIKGSVQLATRQVNKQLKQREILSADVIEALNTIQHNLDRTERQIGMQNRLVSDLLDVARIHANRLELYPELCDLGRLVSECVEDQHYLAPARKIELLSPTTNEILIQADPDRVRQVIGNYLSNALKYSEASKPVKVMLEVRGNTGCVSVRDEGPGLTLEQQHYIWERFYRVPDIEVKSGSGIGLGLGLHICRMIIERQDGQVGVESTPGTGSTFWFTLPLAETVAGQPSS